MKETFNIPGASEVFEAIFRQEVNYRGKQYVPNHELLRCIHTVASWVEDPYSTFGLILSGTPGSGKTTMIKALQELVECSDCKDSSDLDYFGRPSSAHLRLISALEFTELYKTDNKRFHDLKCCYLLAIDDLGIENVDIRSYGNEISPILEVLYYRYENMLTTIISTNIPNNKIRERYGVRLADRFNEMMTCIAFPAMTFRVFR